VAGLALYFGREGAEVQRATGRPKAETLWLPMSPWAWPRQMQIDAAAPAAASLAAWGLWWAVSRGNL
jgi:hypothetical protein